eukprot:1563162-Rhodomonas_salina.1
MLRARYGMSGTVRGGVALLETTGTKKHRGPGAGVAAVGGEPAAGGHGQGEAPPRGRGPPQVRGRAPPPPGGAERE